MGAAGGVNKLAEQAADIGIVYADPAGFAFSGGLVVAGTDANPGIEQLLAAGLQAYGAARGFLDARDLTMARADWPWTSLTTTPRRIPLSVRTLCRRFFSEANCPTSFCRCLVPENGHMVTAPRSRVLPTSATYSTTVVQQRLHFRPLWTNCGRVGQFRSSAIADCGHMFPVGRQWAGHLPAKCNTC